MQTYRDERPILDQLNSRWAALQNEYQSFKVHQQELNQYLMPRTGRFLSSDRNKSTSRNEGIIDNTGTRAARTMAAALMAMTCSPSEPWGRFRVKDPMLNKRRAVRQWLDYVNEKVFEQVLAPPCNFYLVAPQLFLEMGVYGTAAAIVLPHPDRTMHFYPLTAGQYCIAANDEGEINTLYREFDMSVAQMVRQFGRENCSPEVCNLWDRKELDAWRTVMHAIEPREDRDTRMLDDQNMPWRSVYWEKGRTGQMPPLRVSGFRQFPCVVPRWAVTPGDAYGHGPGMECLEDVKSLQQEQFRKAQAIDYMVKPPVKAPTDMKNTEMDMDPGAVNFSDATGQNAGVQRMWDVTLEIAPLMQDIAEIQGRINSSNFVDVLLMIHNADKNGMTAREVMERHAEKMMVLGEVNGRIQTEFLAKVLDLAFDYAEQAGLIPEAPPEIQGMRLDIEYTSALSQALRLNAVQQSDRFMASVGAVAAWMPNIVDKIDADAWADDVAERLGIPAKIVRDDQMVGEVRAARAQADAAKAQSAMIAEQAGAARDGATAAKMLKAPQEAAV